MTEGTFELGATGVSPDGSLHPSDEGELALALGVVKDRVVLEFGKKIKWLGLTAEDAARMAELLNLKAECIAPGISSHSNAALLSDLAEYFEAKAEEEHTNAMDANEVSLVAVYSNREQVWREVAKEIRNTVEIEDAHERPAEEQEGRYVDEIEGFGYPGEHDPCAVRVVEQEAKKDVD